MLYEGFWYFPISLDGIVSAQQHFNAQPTDILLCRAPKSGSTRLKALSYAIATRTHFDQSKSPLLASVPRECIPLLEVDLAGQNPNYKREPLLPLLATHIPYASSPKSIFPLACKIVYIFRDPKDTLDSLWHFRSRLLKLPKDKEVSSLQAAFESFCEGKSAYGPYWDHVLGYWKASLECPEKVLIMKYEDLIEDTSYHVKRLAEFMGYSFSLEEVKEGVVEKIIKMCRFDNLGNLDVNKTGKHRSDGPFVIKNNIYFRKVKMETGRIISPLRWLRR